MSFTDNIFLVHVLHLFIDLINDLIGIETFKTHRIQVL